MSTLEDLENSDEELELKYFKTADQLRLETLIQRLSWVCLSCSALLFIGQIITVSATHNPDTSSVVSGFILSLFLFLAWFSIHRIYNENGPFKEAIIQPLSFKIRLRSVDEIRLMIPKNWLYSLASIYFISSIFMSICEIYLMSEGITSHWSDLGPIHGVRIGLAIVFISTGIMCICLVKREQKWSTLIGTFLVAIAALISASVLASFWYLRADMRLISTMGRPDLDSTKNKVLSHMQFNQDRKLYFPFQPWIYLMVLMNFWPILNVAISLALIFITLSLMISFHITEDLQDPEPPHENRPILFSVIGIILLICGLVLNINMIILPNLGYFTRNTFNPLNEIYNPMTTGVFFSLMGGFIALGIAKHESLAKKLALFIISLCIAASSIYFLYNVSQIFNFNVPEAHQNDVEFYCVERNSSHVCLQNCGFDAQSHGCHEFDLCISSDKVCNGVLDLFNVAKTSENCHDRPYRLMHFYDELFCREKWIGVYISIFGTGAISLLCSVAIWILSLETVVTAFRYARNAIRHAICAQVPIINS